ncbi:cyclopropane-fatty-acyl-phospholipid synthase family protein [Niveispirillum sp.]|uniref:SAM-dependent methyltransferase n=1 Tax=Niveispirillum sp. TaxID=1917217 RepID=UPI001B69BBA0|nr:cyclopropane-fatty-acyl-phospholipid synthase family protein [Niveispirillum sp.]MBP7339701.1 class I SAM-dependent methyltransferase [Niveispirillum sp.]
MTEQTESHLLGLGQTVTHYRPSRMMRLLMSLAPSIRVGSLTIVLPDGRSHRFDGTETGPHGVLYVRNDRLARRMLLGGKLGFCESYLDGDWTSPDVPALFEMALLNEAELDRAMNGKAWVRVLNFLLHAAKPNSKSGSKRNIAYHYDLGNSFYCRWLDPSMTYSAAVYDDLDKPEALYDAQQRKYAAIAARMDLQPGQHVLEIGCGWGGFAEYAAKVVGARVTGVTISQAQHDYAVARMQRAGLSHLVDIRLQDYRDITETFDRIASIEMFEAVGERYWPTYFNAVHERLKPGGKAALQIITIGEDHFEGYRKGADYIQRYIFPGGMLPSPTRLQAEVEAAGLRFDSTQSYGLHYARTLREWQVAFQAAWPELKDGFDNRFKRMWEQYLWYCEAGFKVGTIDVVHVGISKG